MSIYRTVQALIAWSGMFFWAPSAQERKAFELSQDEWARRYSLLVAESGGAAASPDTPADGPRHYGARWPYRPGLRTLTWMAGGLICVGVLTIFIASHPVALAIFLVVIFTVAVCWLMRRHTRRILAEHVKETGSDTSGNSPHVHGNTFALTFVAVAATGVFALDALRAMAWQG
ncbi:hypothetical protein [Streptomyces mirabilis]|uniref:hypothetical protein n=1 Tax=Streptomyces mirabilis TaxID=68239 RepID=UPI0035D5C798